MKVISDHFHEIFRPFHAIFDREKVSEMGFRCLRRQFFRFPIEKKWSAVRKNDFSHVKVIWGHLKVIHGHVKAIREHKKVILGHENVIRDGIHAIGGQWNALAQAHLRFGPAGSSVVSTSFTR